MPDITNPNMKEIERLIAVGRGLGNILVSLSAVKGDPDALSARIDEFVGFSHSADVTRVEKYALDAKNDCDAAETFDEKLAILTNAINESKDYLDKLKAIYGANPSSNDFACAGSLFFSDGHFSYNGEPFTIGGIPGILLHAFITARNNYLPVSKIEQLVKYIPDSAVSRVDHLNRALFESPVKKRCIHRHNYPGPGYKLDVD